MAQDTVAKDRVETLLPIVFTDPPRWDWFVFAVWTRKQTAALPPYISNKIARDIGMNPNDLAPLRREWPLI